VKGQVDRAALQPLVYDVLQAMPEDKRPGAQAHIYDVISKGEKDASEMTPERRAQIATAASADKVGPQQVEIIGAWGWPAYGYGATYGTAYGGAYGAAYGYPGYGFGAWGYPGVYGYGTYAPYGLGYGYGAYAPYGLGYGCAGLYGLGYGWPGMYLGWGGLGAFGWPAYGAAWGVGVPGGWGF
jgi:hypothetical protein